MPINKNALLRYQAIDNCLRNRGRKWTWRDILEKVNEALIEDSPDSKGIGKTTLYEDMKDIEYRVYEADIERNKEGKTVYLRYSDPKFSINNQPLSESEISQIKSAVLVMSRFSGAPQFEWVNEVIPMLENRLGLIGVNKQVIDFESNIDLMGLHWLKTLFNAIVNERVLDIVYKDFKSLNSYHLIIHPYFLKQYNNRWFLFGMNEQFNKPNWNLALDRIQAVSETNQTYIPTTIDWREYFYDMVGVTLPENQEVEEVRLKIFPEQAPYVRTKPLHPTQRVTEHDNWLEVKIRVIMNHELENLILSMGERTQVLAPNQLKEKIVERLRRASSHYQ